MFLNTFLEILGVIGIVAVSAFVIIFLFDLFISIVDGSNGIFFKRHKNDANYENDRPKLLNEPEQKEEVKEEPAKEEVKEEPKQEEVKQEVVEEKAEELVKEEVVEEPAVEEEDDSEAVIASITEETKKELAHAEQEEKLVSENENLNKMIEELRAQIERDKQAIKELEEKVANAPATTTEVVTEKVPQDSKEEIFARLEVLRQRLKENEKELSANKKEFIPLRKVNNTLEKDKKKLRRKEAIVAKQRTVLFGVNNYMEIDNEKAKELDEELELLEGLKLSVQHCEDVMEKNKERYPILERANNFLVKTRNDLRADIKELEDRLAQIESEEQNADESADSAESNE